MKDQLRIADVQIRSKDGYRFLLVKPKESIDLSFQSDGVEFSFLPGEYGIAFTLKNGTESPIKIDWNQLSYVDVNGQAQRVFPDNVRLVQRDASMPPTIVPPTATVTNMLIPSAAVRMDHGGWDVQPIFPKGLPATRLIGRTISIFFPLDIGGTIRNHLFTFKILDVER